MEKKKQVVAGLGEIGEPIMKILSKINLTIGYDIDPKIMNKPKLKKYEFLPTIFLHVCIPFNSKFIENIILLYKKFNPECIVIHSTISPYTTRKIQEKLSIPIIYSATRGIHNRMQQDLRRYTKFFALEKNAPRKKWASLEFSKLMRKCKIKTKNMSDPLTLELAKIVVDTSYYGWLINYAQISNLIAKKHKVDYNEMWSFSEEIHNFLGNRPKMFPGFIGGHCVIPNLSLIKSRELEQIKKINQVYLDKIPEAKKISKKFVKGKQSYDM